MKRFFPHWTKQCFAADVRNSSFCRENGGLEGAQQQDHRVLYTVKVYEGGRGRSCGRCRR